MLWRATAAVCHLEYSRVVSKGFLIRASTRFEIGVDNDGAEHDPTGL